MGWVHYSLIWHVGLFDVAPPRRCQREIECTPWPRCCGSAWPASAGRSAPGCHRVSASVHIAIVMRHTRDVWKTFLYISHTAWIVIIPILTLLFKVFRQHHYRKMFPDENRWDGNDGAPLSVSATGFIRISQHIAHELEISVYYLHIYNLHYLGLVYICQ